MFKRKSKEPSVVATMTTPTNHSKTYEFITNVKFHNDAMYSYMELIFKYRLEGGGSYYKETSHLVVTDFNSTEEQFIKRGIKFMDNFDEEVVKYAKRDIEHDMSILKNQQDKEVLISKMASKNGYQFTIKFDEGE